MTETQSTSPEPSAKPKRKAKTLPTQRTLALLRKRGYLPWIVEKWNSFMKVRQDMWGCIDVIGIRDGETIAVQACTLTHINARRDKMLGRDPLPEDPDKVAKARQEQARRVEALRAMQRAGWRIVIHGWRKVGNKWHVKVVCPFSGNVLEDTHKQKGSIPTEAETEPIREAA